MRTGKRVSLVAVAVTLMGGAIGLMGGYFHLRQTFASAAVGVVVGVGVALGAFSFRPKSTKCHQDIVRRVG